MSRQRVSSTSSRCFPDHVRPNRRYPDGRTDYGVRHLIDHPSALVVPVLYVPNRMRQPVQFLSRKNSLIARSAIKLPWFNSNRRENDRPSRRRRKCIIESERYQSHPLSRERERERERELVLFMLSLEARTKFVRTCSTVTDWYRIWAGLMYSRYPRDACRVHDILMGCSLSLVSNGCPSGRTSRREWNGDVTLLFCVVGWDRWLCGRPLMKMSGHIRSTSQ